MTENQAEPETWEQKIAGSCNESIINKTITIYDCHGNNPNRSMDMTIKVDHANYGAYLYYQIICSKPFEDLPVIQVNENYHPFQFIDNSNIIKKGQYEIGEIVADNPLMRLMFQFLSMTDEELDKHCGNNTTLHYRAVIISTITQLWD